MRWETIMSWILGRPNSCRLAKTTCSFPQYIQKRLSNYINCDPHLCQNGHILKFQCPTMDKWQIYPDIPRWISGKYTQIYRDIQKPFSLKPFLDPLPSPPCNVSNPSHSRHVWPLSLLVAVFTRELAANSRNRATFVAWKTGRSTYHVNMFYFSFDETAFWPSNFTLRDLNLCLCDTGLLPGWYHYHNSPH